MPEMLIMLNLAKILGYIVGTSQKFIIIFTKDLPKNTTLCGIVMQEK